MYRRLRGYALAPISCFVFLVLWYELAFVRNVDLAHNWNQRWLFTDLTLHLGHLCLVLAACWLWMPSERSAYLAGAFQLSTTEENELPHMVGRPDDTTTSEDDDEDMTPPMRKSKEIPAGEVALDVDEEFRQGEIELSEFHQQIEEQKRESQNKGRGRMDVGSPQKGGGALE